MNGWMGKILRVDLTSGACSARLIEPSVAKDYIGGRGLGIGGAHVQSTWRRNIDLTLLVPDNFNYGMTGGQCSSTTPRNAVVGSGFLNKLEKPMDICEVAATAGAPCVSRVSTYDKGLTDELKTAIAIEAFSLVDHPEEISVTEIEGDQARVQLQ